MSTEAAPTAEFGQTIGDADTGGFLSRMVAASKPVDTSPAPVVPDGVKPAAPAAPMKPVEPPKPAEPAKPVVDDEFPPEVKSPKAREDWKALKASRADAQRLADEYKAKVVEYEQKLAKQVAPTVPEEVTNRIAELERERDEYSEKLKLVDVEQHPKFKAYFDGKTQQLTEAAKTIVGAEHVAKVERIMKLSDPDARTQALDDLMLELSPAKQTRLGAVVASLETLQQERAAEIGNAKTRWEQLQQESKAQQQAGVAAKLAQADRLVAAAAEMEAFKAGDKADAARLQQIETYKGFVRGAVTGQLSEQDAQFMPLAAVEGLHLKTHVLPALTKELADLKAQLEPYLKAQQRPSAGGNRTPEGAQPKSFLGILSQATNQG